MDHQFFFGKTVVDQPYTRNSLMVCKTIVGIDASQFYRFSICQEIATEFYTRWEYDSETDRLKARSNRTKISRKWFKIKSFYTTGKQKKIDCFYVDGYCDHHKTVIEAMGCYYHFCSCQKPVLCCQNKISKEKIRGEKWMS